MRRYPYDEENNGVDAGVCYGHDGRLWQPKCHAGNGENGEGRDNGRKPFAKSELGENEKVDYNFSFGVENFDQDAMEIEYTGGELKIDFSVEVQGKEFTCGPMIFIDGINQPYALQAEGEKKASRVWL